MSAALRAGTRRSPLAVQQTRTVAGRLAERLDRPVDLVEVLTQGDVDRAPLATIGGTGVFVSALRDALLAGAVDLAVHSLKDLPTAPADGLELAAVPAREDPRDVICTDGTAPGELPVGARIGTGSPRRAAALRAMGRDFEPVEVRGNVDTRLGKVRDGSLDAVVLAAAGLNRLGRTDVAAHPVDPDVMPPAPGQGALAVEVRADRTDLIADVAALDDRDSRAAVLAERAVLAGLQAGCSAPVGALGRVDGDTLTLVARVWSADATRVLSARRSGDVTEPVGLGHAVATELLRRGAAELIKERAQ